MTEHLADMVVAAALALALAFGVTAFIGLHTAAAWLAFGLAIAGAARLAIIIGEAFTRDY